MTRRVILESVPGRKPQQAPKARLIKRYENRKLYDPTARRYVTLDDLARMIAAGEELHVVDSPSGDDLTTTVLAQVMFEGIKQRSTEVPRQVLARLIRLGARPAAFDWSVPRDAASRARDEAERIVEGLIRRGRLGLEDALALRQEIAESMHRVASEAQRGVEDRLRGLLEGQDAGPGVHPAIEGLKERLLTFESYLDESRPAAAPRTGRRARSRGAAGSRSARRRTRR